MKKSIIFCFLLFSTILFAEELDGIFGIKFGTNSEQTKIAMSERGWNLSNSKEDELIYKKDNGTYASLPVWSIKFLFYKDKLYDIYIDFPFDTKTEDVTNAMAVITKKYSLTSVSERTFDYKSVKILLYKWIDEKGNSFETHFSFFESITCISFDFKCLTISKEKQSEDDKIKQDEKLRKNQSISSDL